MYIQVQLFFQRARGGSYVRDGLASTSGLRLQEVCRLMMLSSLTQHSVDLTLHLNFRTQLQVIRDATHTSPEALTGQENFSTNHEENGIIPGISDFYTIPGIIILILAVLALITATILIIVARRRRHQPGMKEDDSEEEVESNLAAVSVEVEDKAAVSVGVEDKAAEEEAVGGKERV